MHIEAWKTKHSKSGWQYALEFEVQLRLCEGCLPEHQRTCWSPLRTRTPVGATSVQTMVRSSQPLYDKRTILIETFDAMALDAEALPVKSDPRYTHRQVQRVPEADKGSLHERMLARGRGEQINLPAVPAQRSPTSAASTQSEGTSSKSMPARGPPVVQPPVSKQPKLGESTIVSPSLPELWKKHRDILPVSCKAAPMRELMVSQPRSSRVTIGCMRRDVPVDMKKHMSLHVWRTSHRCSPTLETPCQFLFMQYVFTTLRYLLCVCDRFLYHLMCDHCATHGDWSLLPCMGIETSLGGARLIGVGKWLKRLVGTHLGKTS